MSKRAFQILTYSAIVLIFIASESNCAPSKPKCSDIQTKCFDTIMECWQPVWNHCYKGGAPDECATQTDVKKFTLDCQRWFMVECTGKSICGGSDFEKTICSPFGASTSQAYKQCQTDWSNNSTPEIICLYAVNSMKNYDHACD